MIRAVLFDLGGTLHVCSTDEARKLWFARRLISRLSEYGIVLDLSPEELSKTLQENAEIYKHHVEGTLRELPPEDAWADYYFHGLGLRKETLAPIAEELSFLYDYERVCNLRRPHLISTMEELRAMGMRLGIISNMLSRTLVPHFMAEYGLEQYMEGVLTSSTPRFSASRRSRCTSCPKRWPMWATPCRGMCAASGTLPGDCAFRSSARMRQSATAGWRKQVFARTTILPIFLKFPASSGLKQRGVEHVV